MCCPATRLGTTPVKYAVSEVRDQPHPLFSSELRLRKLPPIVNSLFYCLLISSEPISYGRTQQRYITKDGGFLSYPQSAIVSVLAKKAYLTENGDEFWEAEVNLTCTSSPFADSSKIVLIKNIKTK